LAAVAVSVVAEASVAVAALAVVSEEALAVGTGGLPLDLASSPALRRPPTHLPTSLPLEVKRAL